MTLNDIGEGDATALLCHTDQPQCCRPPHGNSAQGNWFFPNGSRVPSTGQQWEFHRTRGQMRVLLHRRRGGVEGVYRCEIPDEQDIIKRIYIGVYTEGAGKGPICFIYAL